MSKKVVDRFECDDILAHELMGRGIPVKVIHRTHYPNGLNVRWININNNTCTAFTKNGGSEFFYNEDVVFEYPIYEGQKTAF